MPNALRISTTITNAADYSQAYPDVQLTLTDAKGKIISRRTFLPGQYVDDYVASDVLVNDVLVDDVLVDDVTAITVQLIPDETETIHFDISNPSKRAIGFEVELVK